MSATHERLPVADGRTVWREVRRSLGGRTWMLVGLVAVVLVAAGAGVVVPLALGSMVDVIAAGGDDATPILVLAAFMAGAGLLGATADGLAVVLGARMFETVLADLRERVVAGVFALPQSRVERAGQGDVVSRATDDVSQIGDAVPEVVPALTGSLFSIVVTAVGMAVVDPRYLLVLVLIVPVHVLAVRWYGRTAPPVYLAERAAFADRAAALLDALHGVETVHAFGLGGRHLRRIAAASWVVARWGVRAQIVRNTFFARLNVAEFLGMGGLLVIGFWLVTTGQGTIGGVTATMLLFLRLFGPINLLLFVLDQVQSALASLARIVGVIDAAPDTNASTSGPAESTAPVEPSPTAERAAQPSPLGFDAVRYAYVSGRYAVDGIDLHVHEGETVAVVGASGAGKSTLAALAAGVHESDEGTVVRPARGGDLVLVTQEVHVFDGTLRDNLRFGSPDASDDEIRAALARIGGTGAEEAFDDGLDARLGAAGRTPGAALAQLIALARVELADPRIVVLDEATAEAGSDDAIRLDEAARLLVRERTALVVAHRLSQAASADRVAVLEHGRIVELGSHDELLGRGGVYATLWAAWREGREH